MTTKARRFDLVPDEFLAGILGMKAEQAGLYLGAVLLELSSGKPISFEDERLFRLFSDRPSHLRKIRDLIVSKGKLQRTGDELSNKRARKEIKAATKRIRSARENGAKGGRPVREVSEKREGTEDETSANSPPTQTTIEENQLDKKPEGLPLGLQDDKPTQKAITNYQPPTTNPSSKEERSSNDGGEGPPVLAGASPNVIQTPKAMMFSSCREYLMRCGCSDANARSLLGKWAKISSEGVVIDIVSEAMSKEIQDPKAWVPATLRARGYGQQPKRRFTV